MPKTGSKYTKVQPAKGTSNQIKRSHSSSQPGRVAQTLGGKSRVGDKNLRTDSTIKRLKMYNNGKAIRNKEGDVVGGQYMMKDRAGDVKINAGTGRVQPDRRWFGNTRVVGATELDKFRDEMSLAKADPYSVVLARKQLPMGLLMDSANSAAEMQKAAKAGLLLNESFDKAFTGKVGGGARKKVKIDQLLVGRDAEIAERKKKRKEREAKTDGSTEKVKSELDEEDGGYGALLKIAQGSNNAYETVNNEEGMVAWGRDTNLTMDDGGMRNEVRADLFLKGQSKRIWAELYKVLDCSDIVLHMVDARNVPGTKMTHIAKHLSKNDQKHKHLVYVLNKVDMVPAWVAKRWVGELSKERPTVAFHASMNHAFGKGALISLLRQFCKLNSEKKQMSVGIVGYPNVGKSSLINCLTSNSKATVTAPVPGQTKVWQYVSLFKNLFLIDSPGIVVDSRGDTEADSVLKSVVRAERLEEPADYIQPILDHVKRENVAACYSLPSKGDGTWTSVMDLLEKISLRAGRLKKGGDPDTHQAAITMINDFQRGKLPWFVPPPELKEDGEGLAKEDDGEEEEGVENRPKILDAAGKEVARVAKQNLDQIVQDGGKEAEGEEADDISVDGEGDDESDSDSEGEDAPVVTVDGSWGDMK